MRGPHTAAACAMAALLACSGGARSSAAEQLGAAESAATTPPAPQQPPPARDDLPAMLDYRAERYAQGLLADGPTHQGELKEGQRTDLLAVLKAGHCYRILGVGGAAVGDLDLMLFDPDGMQTHQDPGQDPYPVLGIQADICPAVAGRFRIQVHMYKGSGSFAVRAYRTPL